MPKVLTSLSFALLLLLSLLVGCNYRSANQGQRLYGKYFSAESPIGYQTLRAVGAAQLDDEASILEQGKRYHQQQDYDMALVSFRAYLESNPEPASFLPELLAGTSAMASGYYDEARDYFERLPTNVSEADGAALWYLSLLDLRDENIDAARGKLEVLAKSAARNQYPVRDVLQQLSAK